MAAVWTPLDSSSLKVVQTTNEGAPSWDPTNIGFKLVNVGGYHIILEADAGQVLTGTGSLNGYYGDMLVGGWSYSDDLKLVIPATAAGQRRYGWLGWTDANPRGLLAHMANGIGVDGGGLTLYYLCTTLRAHRN